MPQASQTSLADKFNATLIGLSALGPPLFDEGVVIQEVTESDTLPQSLSFSGFWRKSELGERGLTGARWPIIDDW